MHKKAIVAQVESDNEIEQLAQALDALVTAYENCADRAMRSRDKYGVYQSMRLAMSTRSKLNRVTAHKIIA